MQALSRRHIKINSAVIWALAKAPPVGKNSVFSAFPAKEIPQEFTLMTIWPSMRVEMQGVSDNDVIIVSIEESTLEYTLL